MSKSIKQASEKETKKKSGDKIPQKSGSKGKTAKQIMNKHIKDKNDVISDEDFKNLDVGTEITNNTSHEPLEISEDHERPKDEDKDPKIVTPWDVIT